MHQPQLGLADAEFGPDWIRLSVGLPASFARPILWIPALSAYSFNACPIVFRRTHTNSDHNAWATLILTSRDTSDLFDFCFYSYALVLDHTDQSSLLSNKPFISWFPGIHPFHDTPTSSPPRPEHDTPWRQQKQP
jgi:hypothetical protein